MKQRFYIGSEVNALMESDGATHVKLIDLDAERCVKEYSLPLRYEYIIADIDGNVDRGFQFFFLKKVEGQEDETVAHSNAVFPEITNKLIEDVRRWLGDVKEDAPAWDDLDYLGNIKSALLMYKGVADINFIREQDLNAVRILTQKHYALQVAYNTAKYYDLEAPNVKLSKWEIGQHYKEIADALDKEYLFLANLTNRTSGGYDEQGIINEMPSFKTTPRKRSQKPNRIHQNYVTSRYF